MAAACSGPANKQVPPPLVHPGILITRPMLEHIRANVQARREPQGSAYLDVMNPNHTIGPSEGGRAAVWLANLSYVPEPEKLWVRRKLAAVSEIQMLVTDEA